MTAAPLLDPSGLFVSPVTLPTSHLEQMRDQVGSGMTRSQGWRMEQLNRLGELITNHEQEVLEALSADLGKPQTEAFFELIALRQELKLTIKNLRRWMRPRVVPVPLAQRPGQATVIPEPLGCVLIIGPWNLPFSLTLQPLISALAAGNTAVLKPSEQAPSVSSLISRLVSTHFDNTVVTVVEGDGAVAAELVSMPFDHIFFTGEAASDARFWLEQQNTSHQSRWNWVAKAPRSFCRGQILT